MYVYFKKSLWDSNATSPKNLFLDDSRDKKKPVEARLVGQAVETAREAPGELLPSTWLLIIRSSTPM